MPDLQIMPLENEMKTPRSFMKPCGVLNIAMGCIVMMYTALGFFGYIRYGSKINGSITLNLPTQESLGIAVQLLLAIAIFFTHPIQCYVAIDILWNEYIGPLFDKYRHKQLWAQYAIRIFIILITCECTLLDPTLPFQSDEGQPETLTVSVCLSLRSRYAFKLI